MSYFAQVDLRASKPGEKSQKLLQVAPRDGPASLYLRPGVSNVLSRSTILIVSTLDSTQRPCITVWKGHAGFVQGVGRSNMAIRAVVHRQHDQVIDELLGFEAVGEVVLDGIPTKIVSMLGIDLEAYTRVKIHGRLASGAMAELEDGSREILLLVSVERSFITCPRAFSPKHMLPNKLLPVLLSQSLPLIPDIVDVLARAEVLFVSSSNGQYLEIDQRSGLPGFVHLDTNDETSCILVYPEYSGIRLYQTMDISGNIPVAALLVPDFRSGNAVFITGRKEVLVREDGQRVLPQSNTAVKIIVESVRYIENGLSFSATQNLRGSNAYGISSVEQVLYDKPKEQIYARLVDKQPLTPTITRYAFYITDSEKKSRWEPGQYVTLGFEWLLHHPSRSDTQSSSDADARKFTISSKGGELSDYSQFEITIRKVGIITNFLSSQDAEIGLEIPIRGFAGELICQQGPQETIGLAAGGVGITPFLAQVDRLNLSRVRVYWTVKAEDLGLVLDSFERAPDLCGCTRLFVTGNIDDDGAQYLAKLSTMKATVETRRMVYDDLRLNSHSPGENIRKWYVCAGAALRKTLLGWLSDRNVIFETFNF